MWDIDVMGPINLPSARGHQFILAITNYFSKWAEAVHSKKSKQQMSSSLSNIMLSTTLAFHDGSSMTMDRNLSATLSKYFAPCSESKACRLQHITHQPMAMPK